MSRKAVLTADPDVAPRPKLRLADAVKPRLQALGDAITLRLHALADRLDRIPSGFGDETPVDDTDPAALRREWRRQFAIWAGSSPEQLFALKAGALMLGGLLVLILLAVAAF